MIIENFISQPVFNVQHSTFSHGPSDTDVLAILDALLLLNSRVNAVFVMDAHLVRLMYVIFPVFTFTSLSEPLHFVHTLY
jgi:hypothetical protein